MFPLFLSLLQFSSINPMIYITMFMAEREGFEPSVPILSEHTISSRAPSASRASLRLIIISNSNLLRSVYRLRRERGMCSLTKFAPPPPRSFGGSPNPRSRFCRNTRFPVVPLRPLGHLSVISPSVKYY